LRTVALLTFTLQILTLQAFTLQTLAQLNLAQLISIPSSLNPFIVESSGILLAFWSSSVNSAYLFSLSFAGFSPASQL
jgi:hypothetical protein